MNKFIALFFVSCCLFFTVQPAEAQKTKKNSKTKVRLEAVKEKCKDTPLYDRIRVTVARFTATTANAPAVLGENMSTMLTNALSQVNCYNVLEEQKNLSDMTGEIDASDSEYFNAATGIEKGKMKLAQIIVTGEVTEYNDATTGSKILGIGGSVKKAKIGFILKIINPRTREILKSTSINAESRTAKSFQVSIFSKKSSSDPAVTNALEEGIIKATEYLAEEMDDIPLPSDDELNSNLSKVIIAEVSFSQKNQALNAIESTSGTVKTELASFSDNTAVFQVRHTGSTNDLATALDRNHSDRFEITGMKSGEISMRMK